MPIANTALRSKSKSFIFSILNPISEMLAYDLPPRGLACRMQYLYRSYDALMAVAYQDLFSGSE